MIQLPDPWRLLSQARDRIERDKKLLDVQFVSGETPDAFLDDLNKALRDQYEMPNASLHKLRETGIVDTRL